MSVQKWQVTLSSWSPSTFTPTDYVPLKGKRSILVPHDRDVHGLFSLRRRGSDVDLYQVELVVRVVESSLVVRSFSIGLTKYDAKTERYKLQQIEPSLTDFDLRALNLQQLAARLIAKVSLTNKITVKYVDDYDEFKRQLSRGVDGIAFGDRPKPILTDAKGVTWYKVFTFDSDAIAQNAFSNQKRRTVAKPTSKQVAKAYKEALDKGLGIYDHLETEFNTSPKNIERWIRQAKDDGLIAKTRSGRPQKAGK